ncbi:MAG: DUF1669 domain-containing protein [Planctomycetes bacterium]|nr:DUF1669 domain-containing protein [Planctomycetota bacterium]
MALLVPATVLAIFAGWQGAPDTKSSGDVIFAPTGSERLVEKRIVRELRAARKKVVAAIYQFTSKDVAEALIAAKHRGVDVRVLVDGWQASNARGVWGEALRMLADARVSIKRVHPAGAKEEGTSEALRAKFHHKFMVIDGERVMTGSYNWTVLADEENYENLVILSSRSLATQFGQEFEKIWKDGKIAVE